MNDINYEIKITPRFEDGQVLTANDLNDLYADIQGTTEAIKNLNDTIGIGIDQIPETDSLLGRVNTLENSLTETDPEAAEGSEATFADRVSNLEGMVGANINGKTLSQRVESLENKLTLTPDEELNSSNATFADRVVILEEQVLATEAGNSTESLVNRVKTLETKEEAASKTISNHDATIGTHNENISNINKAIGGSPSLVYDKTTSLDARVSKLEDIRVITAKYNTSNPDANAGADILWSETIPDSLKLKSGQLYFKVM